MGKAIVIKGLEVTNPLTTVTFLSVESVLRAYYLVNGTINSTEKAALETFVGGILDANLWDKVSYFYPMLGNSVADMLLDVVSPSTEDVFNGTSFTGLSVTNRVLVSDEKAAELLTINTSRIVNALNMENMGLISSHTSSGTAATDYSQESIMGIMRNSDNKIILNIGIDSGAYRMPVINVGVNNNAVITVPASQQDVGNQQSYTERIIFGDYNGITATIYKDTTIFATGTSYPETITQGNYTRRQILYTSTDRNATGNNFFAITKHLTQSEWTTFYGLLLTFLKAVGKHS